MMNACIYVALLLTALVGVGGTAAPAVFTQSPDKKHAVLWYEEGTEYHVEVFDSHRRTALDFSALTQAEQDVFPLGTFEYRSLKWFKNRFMVSVLDNDEQLGAGIGVIDVEQKVPLLERQACVITRAPHAMEWSYIATRPSPRTEDFDYHKYRDKLGVIDLEYISKHAQENLDLPDKLPILEVAGILVTPPMYFRKGRVIGFIQVINGSAELGVVDAKTLKSLENRRIDLKVSEKLLRLYTPSGRFVPLLRKCMN